MPSWPNSLRGLRNPPVVEIALAVQFAPIPGLTPAHFGVFWKEHLGDSWATPRAVMPLEESFESFGPIFRAPQFRFEPIVMPAGRIQFFGRGGRILQLQNNKLVLNWKKGETGYPSFEQTASEFVDCLGAFRSFLRGNGLEDILANQWELTYIDQVPRGTLWRRPGDLHTVFPGLFPAETGSEGNLLEGQDARRRYEIESRRGRVYLQAETVMLETGSEVVTLTSWARGPVTADTSIEAGLKLGHEAIGRAFVSVTSDAAFKFWEGSSDVR